jgi:16S rRNA (guanine527-N7)-methyltransferase
MTATERLDVVLHESQNRGFIGPGSVASHRAHAEAFLDLLPPQAIRGVDLGTGGGLPGLVLAVARPAMHWTFVESSVTRARFLTQALVDLEVAGTVVAERAETVGRGAHRSTFDVVTARSFGRPAVVAECAAPLLVPGGRLIVSEPPTESSTDRWPVEDVAALGFGPAVRVAGPPHLVTLDLVGVCPDDAPRKVGLPAKRPRF